MATGRRPPDLLYTPLDKTWQAKESEANTSGVRGAGPWRGVTRGGTGWLRAWPRRRPPKRAGAGETCAPRRSPGGHADRAWSPSTWPSPRWRHGRRRCRPARRLSLDRRSTRIVVCRRANQAGRGRRPRCRYWPAGSSCHVPRRKETYDDTFELVSDRSGGVLLGSGRPCVGPGCSSNFLPRRQRLYRQYGGHRSGIL